MFTTVLFDIDGVMLSEERYFDASALTVHELLSNPQYMGLKTAANSFTTDLFDDHILNIREHVFLRDTVLESLKNVGVNANWDMVYLCFVAEFATAVKQFHGDKSVFRDVLKSGWSRETLAEIGAVLRQEEAELLVEWSGYQLVYASAQSREDLFSCARQAMQEQLGLSSIDEFDEHQLWMLCQQTFQEWYLGDSYTGKQTGKAGFLTNEIPIVDPADLSAVLEKLVDKGITIGIATGRPRTETEVPLDFFGWWKHFNPLRVTTASEVLEAESEVPSARPLSKPSPYSYLRSFQASDDVSALLHMDLPLPNLKDEVLIIGDSIADALAAKRLGVSFAGVLTGLEGEAARPKFEQLDADYIFSDVLQIKEVINV